MVPLILALYFAPQEKPPEKATLSGTVVNSVTRQPLARVMVLAEPAVQGPAASTTTDAAGRFELVGLDPGQYHVKGQRNGYQETYYGARRVQSKGTAISLDPGQQWKDLEIKLLPYAVIAGTVRDTDGEPIANTNVSILSLVYEEGFRKYSTEVRPDTDDLGQYRALVPPGRYYVRAEPEDQHDAADSIDHSAGTARPRERLLPMFYSSLPLHVEPGARLTAIDITLPRSRVFRVKVHVDTPAGLTPRVSLLTGRDGDPSINFRTDSKGRGDFEVRNVPPGSYVLEAAAALPALPETDPIQLMLGADRSYRARLPIQVGNADVDGIRIAVKPGAEITGRLTVEGDNPPSLTGTRLRLTGVGNADYWIREGNTFQATPSPGRYEVYVKGPRELVTKSIRYASVDVLAEGLTIDGPSKVSLDIVMTRDAGHIAGVVLDKDEKPVAGATVVLIPAPARRHRSDLYLTTTADQYGRYEMKSVTPGEYKILAWDDVEPGAWFDADVLKELEKHGALVTVQAKGRETVRVHAIPVP